MINKSIVAALVISIMLFLSGCSAMNTAIKKRNLEVKTKMSETIFLEPSSNRTVYLQIKNTSDKDMSALQSKISHALRMKGYKIVKMPSTAHYWIQANVLKADKIELRDAQGCLQSGFESSSSLTGMAIGAGIAGYNNNSIGAVLGVGLVAGLAGTVADALIEDINYTMITDVQIAERIINCTKVQTLNKTTLRQGALGNKVHTSIETGNQHNKYQTRIVSIANKVNLKFDEAKPVLEDQLAQSIVGLL
ncbi:Lipoprotein YlpA precursor [Candidatus Hoaglandella endobia]|uniref:TraT complement resistance protein n=2 Tax=Candidatus Hoaglandella endobia TaxID=1778263 RepID=A0A143WUM0_9ENTR|nr:Lipoprotein YlpA precursor [Candidatus Hoaglandella endobia]